MSPAPQQEVTDPKCIHQPTPQGCQCHAKVRESKATNQVRPQPQSLRSKCIHSNSACFGNRAGMGPSSNHAIKEGWGRGECRLLPTQLAPGAPSAMPFPAMARKTSLTMPRALLRPQRNPNPHLPSRIGKPNKKKQTRVCGQSTGLSTAIQ